MLKIKFNNIKNRFLRQGTLRSISILAGSTAVSQLILLAVLPVLTRLYTPENFSSLAVFVSISSVLGVIGCLRFEMAVPIPESREEGFAILVTALLISLLISLLSLICLLLFRFFYMEYYSKLLLIQYIYLVPISIWMASTSLALQYWLAREKRFSVIAQSKMSRSISGSAIQLLSGLYGILTLGLVYGHIVIHGAGVTRQGFSVLKNDLQLIKQFEFSSIFTVFKKYRSFSYYSSLGAFFNSISAHVPILIIAAFAFSAEAGFLMLATRVLSSPISLIGSSVGQVFISNAAVEYRAGRLGNLAKRNIIGLMKVGVGPLIFLTVVAPSIFRILFGEEWIRAGDIVRWMTPWIIMQFLCAPIATSLQIIRREDVTFKLNLFGFFLRTGVVAVFALTLPMLMVEMYALSGFIFYSMYFFTIINMIGINIKDMVFCIQKSFLVISIWIGFSSIAYTVLKVLGDIWRLT